MQEDPDAPAETTGKAIAVTGLRAKYASLRSLEVFVLSFFYSEKARMQYAVCYCMLLYAEDAESEEWQQCARRRRSRRQEANLENQDAELAEDIDIGGTPETHGNTRTPETLNCNSSRSPSLGPVNPLHILPSRSLKALHQSAAVRVAGGFACRRVLSSVRRGPSISPARSKTKHVVP